MVVGFFFEVGVVVIVLCGDFFVGFGVLFDDVG